MNDENIEAAFESALKTCDVRVGRGASEYFRDGFLAGARWERAEHIHDMSQLSEKAENLAIVLRDYDKIIREKLSIPDNTSTRATFALAEFKRGCGELE